MNNEEKRIALSHISHILSNAEIPHVYNVIGETITLRNVDMTDVLLELHCYQDEYIADLHDKINNLEQQISKMKCHANCRHQNDDSFEHRGGLFGCCEHWELRV